VTGVNGYVINFANGGNNLNVIVNVVKSESLNNFILLDYKQYEIIPNAEGS
jgi:hypothetical protein